MNRPMLFALAAAALLRAEAALAGSSCGGGGGGSSSGGSSSSSRSSSDSSSDSSSSAPSCVDETDIVGYRKCTKFGRWSNRFDLPPIILELGTTVRTFESPLGATDGRLTHESESFTYRVVGTPPGSSAPPSETAVLSTMRVGFGLPRGLYVAGDLEIGGLARSQHRAEMTSSGAFGAPSITPGSTLVVGALAVAGVRGETRRATLGVEAAGGLRSVTYQYDSHYLSCETTASHSVVSPILEARARASVWLSPFVSLGATAGASVIDRGAWMAGINLGLVTQAYGNLRD